ncbi:MAG TPA: MarR family transcriptional regulator [Propionicimonas sp.]|nr:MarR family transcriptional regulator [Propionicimonas sp.]HRA05063.1 MarR family transcriptional regulator [Propionicimonas sp.]
MSAAVGFFDALLRYEIELWDRLDGAIQGANGLSLGRLQALRVLRERGGKARVQDVAGDLALTVGATSKLVDRLERDGTARREPNPDDRRSSLIALTPAGISKLDVGWASFESTLAASLPPDVVDAGELDALTATLHRLLAHLRTTTAGVTS